MSRYFDGVNDSVVYGGQGSDEVAFSAGCWVYLSETAGSGVGRALVSRHDGGNLNGWGFLVQYSGLARIARLRAVVRGSAATQTRTQANWTLPFDRWHHVAFTWEDEDASGFKFYVNGLLSSTDTSVGGGSANDSGLPYVIGNQSDNTSDFFGILAHVQVWSSLTISQQQVAQSGYLPGSISRQLVLYAPLWGYSNPEPNYTRFRLNPEGTVAGTVYSNSHPPISHVFATDRPRLEYSVLAAAAAVDSVASDAQSYASAYF